MIAALSALLFTAALAPGSTFTVDPSASTVTYHVVHKLHRVDGVSQTIEGKAVAKDDVTVLAMVRIPVSTFHSGDANRDAHMLEVMEVGKHPFVVFKGLSRLRRGADLTAGKASMQGEVELHGVKVPVTVPLTVEERDGAIRVRGHFDLSLEAHRVERPSLLFVKIDDACGIDVDLLLRKQER